MKGAEGVPIKVLLLIFHITSAIHHTLFPFPLPRLFVVFCYFCRADVHFKAKMWKEEAGCSMINSTVELMTDPTVRLRDGNHLFCFFKASAQHREIPDRGQ